MSAPGITRLTLALLAGAAAMSGCASIPAEARGTPAAGSPITPAEAQEGAKYHPQFVAEFGGEMTGPQATYIEQVGKGIAVQSGLANSQSAFDVTLLNSPVNNAFAVPGGYIYVTRQLVGLMNNEAELAGVLGHEVGHVAARHSAKRQKTAQRNQILGVLGQVLSGALLGNSAIGRTATELASTAPQLATLSYSRGQELEADQLGVQYLARAGYDPRAMATVLTSLAQQNALDAQLQGRDASMPEWASTHPDPASRVKTATQLAGSATGVTNRDTFLSRINGLLYGDDPKQGVIEGSAFIHPDMRLSFTAPQGFYMINSTDAVSINGDAGKAQLTGAAYSGNLESYVAQAFRALGGQNSTLAPQSVQRTTINGIPAAYGTARVTSGQSPVDVVVFAYEFGPNQAYHFAAITPVGKSAVFNPMFNSMRRITAAEAAQVIPRRVEVVTAARTDTVATLARRMAYTDAQEARFRVLNGLRSTDTLVAGQKYKVVVRAN